MKLLSIANPEALALPEVSDLFARAFESGEPANAEAVLAELSRIVPNPHLVVFATRDGARWCGLSIVMAPATRLFSGAQVYHFFNDGGKTSRDMLVAATVEWVRAMGHSAFYGASFSRPHGDNAAHRERAFPRLFKSAGPATRLGAVYRFDLGGEA